MATERTTIEFKSYIRNVESTESRRIENGLDRMADAIIGLATFKAPLLTGALRQSGRIEDPEQLTRTIVFGNSDVPYARRRHYENNKNPQTKYYLQNAGNEIAKRGLEGYIE